MPQFYFDLVNGERMHDRFGIKLPDLAAARAHAQKIADQLMKDRDRIPANVTKIAIKDGKFNTVLSVPVRPEP
jgi:hypothetical protein